jgi:hypothetical protein
MSLQQKPVESFSGSREKKLKKFWRKKAGIDYSDFEALFNVRPPSGNSNREPAYDVMTPRPHCKASADDMTIAEIRSKLSHIIAAGLPLSYSEYHLAIAFGLLLSEEFTYEEFFRLRWHETPTHRGYTTKEACYNCKAESRKARDACRKKKSSS